MAHAIGGFLLTVARQWMEKKTLVAKQQPTKLIFLQGQIKASGDHMT